MDHIESHLYSIITEFNCQHIEYQVQPCESNGLKKNTRCSNSTNANKLPIFKASSFNHQIEITSNAKTCDLTKIASVTIHCDNDNFIGNFSLYSSHIHNSKGIDQKKLNHSLRLIHFYLSRTYPSKVNPYINSGKFKPRSIEVIKQIANGDNRLQAAKKLNLSTRGVDYHLECFKYKFGARNNADLIRLAKEYCII